MRKSILSVFALAVLMSGTAFAQAAFNNISLKFNLDGTAGTDAGRRFNTSRTAQSQGCSIQSGSSTCPSVPGHVKILHGYNPDGYACCEWIPRDQVTADDLREREMAAQGDFEQIFGATEAYWGYVSTSNKSPASGRTVATEAKLDACIGHGSVDTIKGLASFQQLSTCRGASYCGSSVNGHCTTTQANGETLCQDRCDCVFGGSCNNY